jgi:GT2 family glycosyltransferase
MPELAFVIAEGQNNFFIELAQAITDELKHLGVASSIVRGEFPTPRPGLVYVLIAPHEYFRLAGPLPWPQEALLARSVLLCAEQPGSSFFEENSQLARHAGAVFDVNPWAARELVRRGIRAEHFQLGYTARWHVPEREGGRDIDIAFMGSMTHRRAVHLASYARLLTRRRCHILLSDGSHANPGPSPSFVTGESKRALLARTKVLVNLHQNDDLPYFEWLRATEALLAGCVLVSEHSAGFQPLRPGEHFVSGRPETLGVLANSLVDDDEARRAIQTRAQELLEGELPLAASVEKLVSAARHLDEAPLPAERSLRRPRILHRPAAPSGPQPANVTDNLDAAVIRGALKDVRLELIEMRRHVRQREGAARDGQAPSLAVHQASAAHDAARPRISVLMAMHNHGEQAITALESAAASTYDDDLELIVVDDGSTDESLAQITDWIAGQPEVPALLLRQAVNGGLPSARNAALGYARGEFCFILDADNSVYPHALGRLTEALDEDPGAAFAYGLLEWFDSNGPVGLKNAFAWEPRRLRVANHIDAMALIRTATLRRFGGYTTDRRMYGWEDYELWCRFAEEGEYGVLVREIIARYRASHGMARFTDISTSAAYSALAERCPKLMHGVRLPL